MNDKAKQTLAIFDMVRNVDKRKLTFQTLLGGFSVYALLKGSGMPNSAAVPAAVVSALTSAGALSQDGKKADKSIPPPETPTPPDN